MGTFYMCSTAALEALSKTAFKVYSYLCLSANNFTRDSYKSKNTIAKACKISISSVVRATKELCEKGLLEIKKRFKENGRQTSNLYILLDCTQLKMGAEKPSKRPNSSTPSSNTEKAKDGVQTDLRLFKCASIPFHAELSANELKVYSYLSFRAGKDGQCMPAKKDIAAGCGISVPTVSRAIRKLQHENLISVVPQTREKVFGNNGISVNIYILNTVQLTEPPKQEKKHINVIILIKVLFSYLLPLLTPSHISLVIPQRTISRMKVTNNLRNKSIFSKLTKWYRLYKGTNHAGAPP